MPARKQVLQCTHLSRRVFVVVVQLRSLGERVANACKALDTEQLKLLLAEARALNHTLPNDSEVRGLLMMPEANLLLLKLERFHDGVLPPTVNVAEASQRLMQIQYEEDKTQFTFANFPGFSDLARRAQDLGRLDHSTMAGSKLGFAITKAAGTARGGAIFEHIRSYVLPPVLSACHLFAMLPRSVCMSICIPLAHNIIFLHLRVFFCLAMCTSPWIT